MLIEINFPFKVDEWNMFSESYLLYGERKGTCITVNERFFVNEGGYWRTFNYYLKPLPIFITRTILV